MTSVIQESILDEGLKDWIVPNFTTTTDLDKSIASVVMMGTLKHYFEYTLMIGCGFPSVTLLGDKSDWEDIRRRIDLLPYYHQETAERSHLLVPTVDHMIAGFDYPESKKVKEFWMRACHEAGPLASGFPTLSGWVTAFCFWNEEGKRIGGYSDQDCRCSFGRTTLEERKRLILDGISFPLISPDAIAKSIVTAPVIVKNFAANLEYKMTMVAGAVGMELTEEGTTVQPISGWWMLKDSSKVLQESAPKTSTGQLSYLNSRNAVFRG